MRGISLVTVLLFIASGLYGQESEHAKFLNKDSIELINTWKKFKISLKSRDTKSLRQLSLKTVHCDLFQTPNPNATYEQDISNSYISFDKFLVQFYRNLPKLKLWSVMKTQKYSIVESAYNFRPPNIKYLKVKSLKFYDILYVTFEPNEIEKGHEGQQEGFEFVKIYGKYKFFGLTSIP
jgi:hypothetical protein